MIFWIKIRIVCIKSILHWYRMRRWVKKQDFERYNSGRIMEDAIGENWEGDYCSLCDMGNECFYCLLGKIKQMCCEEHSPYSIVGDSDNWGEWYINSKQMILTLWKALFLG